MGSVSTSPRAHCDELDPATHQPDPIHASTPESRSARRGAHLGGLVPWQHHRATYLCLSHSVYKLTKYATSTSPLHSCPSAHIMFANTPLPLLPTRCRRCMMTRRSHCSAGESWNPRHTGGLLGSSSLFTCSVISGMLLLPARARPIRFAPSAAAVPVLGDRLRGPAAACERESWFRVDCTCILHAHEQGAGMSLRLDVSPSPSSHDHGSGEVRKTIEVKTLHIPITARAPAGLCMCVCVLSCTTPPHELGWQPRSRRKCQQPAERQEAEQAGTTNTTSETHAQSKPPALHQPHVPSRRKDHQPRQMCRSPQPGRWPQQSSGQTWTRPTTQHQRRRR